MVKEKARTRKAKAKEAVKTAVLLMRSKRLAVRPWKRQSSKRDCSITSRKMVNVTARACVTTEETVARAAITHTFVSDA